MSKISQAICPRTFKEKLKFLLSKNTTKILILVAVKLTEQDPSAYLNDGSMETCLKFHPTNFTASSLSEIIVHLSNHIAKRTMSAYNYVDVYLRTKNVDCHKPGFLYTWKEGNCKKIQKCPKSTKSLAVNKMDGTCIYNCSCPATHCEMSMIVTQLGLNATGSGGEVEICEMYW